MSTYQFIRVEIKENVLWISLNRSDVRNAFNDQMISELRRVMADIRTNPHLKVMVLTGLGKAFCAGADLSWMKKVVDYDYDDNVRDSLELANLLWDIEDLAIPTIARVQGPAVGGGVGLVAVCDIALASEKAWFSLAEVKLGLAPAVISPFLLRKIGDRLCRELFLTGKRVSALKAKEIGLVNDIMPSEQLDLLVEQNINLLQTSSPHAIAACKNLLRVIPYLEKAKIKEFTAHTIAQLRMSPEGQEGMKAFLEKRNPNWIT
ncbi:enoyl-CoA hydratase-related protein [candidate division CSSED10-310 bacterium]|uniref:Enoyl-CoA hydratase-related protein n=1 Tax=candidate division CSSED10-310 bacterium TaxID=2855610 RepID=A0ABV6YW87_UNCC1